MSKSVNPGRRRYRSSVRAEQATLTRQRILEAATTLFVERGYASTTIAVVADAADVSPETIYATLGGKRGLLEGVIDAMIPMRPEQDAQLAEVERLPSSQARL